MIVRPHEFVRPALAKPLPADFNPRKGEWIAEEKYDGHRMIVCRSAVPTNLLGEHVIAWSRYGLERGLPPHARRALEDLPVGTYDGELLVPGQRSYGVTVKEDAGKLVYVVFDVTRMLGIDTTRVNYTERRRFLAEIFKRKRPGLKLSKATTVRSREHLDELAQAVWGRDGEGLIVKRAAALYPVGKRTWDWLKVKKLGTTVITIVRYEVGEMGPHSVLVGRDDDGFETSVKWKNYAELDRLDNAPDSFIGRRLRIEYHERTPDGSYRHPRWDRWEDE